MGGNALNLNDKNKNKLIRSVGSFGIVLLAINAMMGAGIFTLPSIVVSRVGTISPWLFLIVGLGVITIVLTFGRLASFFTDSGGPILYANSAFGPLVGFSTGWILYISRIAAFGANSNALTIYLGTIWPWVNSSTGRGIVISTICVGLTWINYVGVKDSLKALTLFTFLKLTPIFFLIIIGLKHISPEIFLDTDLPDINGLGPTILLLIYAFVGFESATYVSGESTDPKKSLPKAMIQSAIFIAIFYFLISLVYVSAIPSGNENENTLVSLGEFLLGSIGAVTITFAAVFSIGGNLASMMLAVPRLTFSLSEKNLLPKWFRNVHKRHKTPSNSILFFGLLTLIFALSGSFVFLVMASSLTRLLSYIASICALPFIVKKADEKTKSQSFNLLGGYTIPAIALAVCLWITAQSNLDAWELTLLLLSFGLILFYVARRNHKVY
jgi:APA family basic amino acid/polyamine antiporter